jgi:hypothetical protein
VSSANIAPIGQISRRYHHQTLPSAWRAEPSILHPDGWSVIGPAGYAVRRLWGNGGRNIGKPNPLRNRFFQKSLLGIGRSKKSSKSPAFGPFHRFSERKLPQRRCQAGKAILEISWQRCSAFQRSLQTERSPHWMFGVRCWMFDVRRSRRPVIRIGISIRNFARGFTAFTPVVAPLDSSKLLSQTFNQKSICQNKIDNPTV